MAGGIDSIAPVEDAVGAVAPEDDDELGGIDDEDEFGGIDPDEDELGGIDPDEELDEPEDIPPDAEPAPAAAPLLDGVPDAPMPPVVDDPVLPEPIVPVVSPGALAERVEVELLVSEVSPVDAHAPRTSDAAASVVIASDLMRMNPSPWKSVGCLPSHS